MKIAAIDLGTNTFLCLIAEVKNGSLKVLSDQAQVVRLGEKVHENKKFSPQALTRASQCLGKFRAVIDKHDVDHVVATATSAARDVGNGQELLDLGLKRKIPITIIEGEKEARLSFEGAISALPQAEKENILVVDVGGGSTELIFRRAGEKKIKGESFNVGCVRLTEMFLKTDPPSTKEYEDLYHFGLKALMSFGKANPSVVIAVAGTPTTFAAIVQNIEFDERKVEGFVLKKEVLNQWTQKLKALSLGERKKIRGLEPLRADVIVAGGALLLGALEVCEKTEMRVSTRGLRYGVALNYNEFI